MGSAFHIGDGFFLTARHVVAGNQIVGVVQPSLGPLHEIFSVTYPLVDEVDLALLSTDFAASTAVPLGWHLDDWINDSILLEEVLLMGYPRVPRTKDALLVATTGEVNAVVDRYDWPGVYFVISSVPRGGFSGGPVIGGSLDLLGVLVEELSVNDERPDAPFACVLSVEPIYHLLEQCGVAPRANRASCFLVWQADGDHPAVRDLLSPDELQELVDWRDDLSGHSTPVDIGLQSPPLLADASLWRDRPSA